MKGRLLAGIALLAAGAALVFALREAQRLPDGSVPVAWDREACARCRMLVSDPHFAAQLQTTDGRVLVFDDPGGLLLYVHERELDVHAVWFHHLREDRWIARDAVGFVPAEPTPMNYGLGAVDRGAGALDVAAALEQALAREAARREDGP